MNWFQKISSSPISISIDKYTEQLRSLINDLVSFSQQQEEQLSRRQWNHVELIENLKKIGYDTTNLQKAIFARDSFLLFRLSNQLYDDLKEKIDTSDLFKITSYIRDLAHYFEIQEGKYYRFNSEVASKEIEKLSKLTYSNMEKIVNLVQEAISRIEDWNNSIIKIEASTPNKESDYLQPINSASIILNNKSDFSIFIDNNGNIIVDDILEGGDDEFFQTSQSQIDYFNLIREINKPGSSSKGKIITLYTARPRSDRNIYLNNRVIPSNIFLTNNKSSAEGLGIDLGGERDLWRVKIDTKYLVETMSTSQEKHYQAIGNGSIPVKSIEFLGEIS